MKQLYIFILSFLFSVSNAQTWNWAKSVSSNGPDKGNVIAYDGQGNIYVAGKFYTYYGPVVIADTSITNNALIKYSKTGTISWALNVNGLVSAISTDAFGNIYITGSFENTARFGDSLFTSAGQMDVFVAKINSAGKFIWAKHGGGAGYDECLGIAVGSDSSVVIAAIPPASFTISGTPITSPGGGVLLIKYSLNGDFKWVKAEGYNNKAMGIAIDSDNNILVSGFFSFSSDFGGGTTIPGNGNNSGAFIAKYNSTGNFVWVKTGMGAGNDNAQKLVLDGNNNVYLTGYFENTIDFGGSTTLISNTSMKDIFIAKYNATGQIQWAKRDGTYDIDISNSIAWQGNHVFITGFWGVNYPSSTNIFVKTFDLNGNYLMSVRIDSTDLNPNQGSAITADEDGNVYITGQFKNSLHFNNSISLTSFAANDFDFFVAKLNPAIIPQSVQPISGTAGLTIYPNPASDKIILEIEGTLTANKAVLSVYNIQGQILSQQALMQGKSEIDISKLAKGIYILKLNSDNKTEVTRIIKE